MLVLEQIRTITLLCLSVFGCTGNILIIIVVNQRFFRKTASAVFITALCIADCIVLCLHSLQIVAKRNPRVTSYDCVVFFFMDVFRLLSVWIVCFINIERCSLVFNPCHLPRLTSQLKSRIFVMVLFLMSLLIFSHYAVHMHIKYIYKSNQTNPVLSLCAFKEDLHRVTWESVRLALTYWLTIPLCIICNVIIIKRLYQATCIERTLNPNSLNALHLSNKQRQLTAMLVASSVCFVLTATPSTIHAIYLSITHNVNNYQYTIHIFTNILLHFHHTSNFIIFLFSSRRFRLELIEFFRHYLHCPKYTKWYKRSTPPTEQIVIYSNRQQKSPIKLLAPKSNTQRRNNQNGIILLSTNNYHKRNGRNHGYCMQTHLK